MSVGQSPRGLSVYISYCLSSTVGEMNTKTSRKLSIIDLIPDLHKDLIAMAQASGKTIKKYVTDSLEERIQRDLAKEDRLWGDLLKRLGKKVSQVWRNPRNFCNV